MTGMWRVGKEVCEDDLVISSFRGREDTNAINGAEHKECGPALVMLG